MSPKYQVFVSSTYEDLKLERDQVIRATLEMGHIPVGMEMFSAADEEQWRIIARQIEQSDYYVVIVAHRYGSEADGVSYTRKEYEFALEIGVPILGFVINPAASWPADRVDKASGLREKLTDFKDLIRRKPISAWNNADDLHGKYSIALGKAINTVPRPGWVRAVSGAGPEVMAELTRLSSENASLRDRIERQDAHESTDRANEIDEAVEVLKATSRHIPINYKGGDDWEDEGSHLLAKIFWLIGPEMIVEAGFERLAQFAGFQLCIDDSRTGHTVPHNVLKGLLTDLMLLNLVEPSTRKHSVTDPQEYWSLTPFGIQVLKHLRLANFDMPLVSIGMPNFSPRQTKKAPTKKAPTKKA